METQPNEPAELAKTTAEVLPGGTCDEPGCGEPAFVSYQWAWGETGQVCPTHQTVRAQQAANLKREIIFTVLNPNAATAISPDERRGFYAEILALKDELAEAKGHGADLYRNNTRLNEQAQAMTTRFRSEQLAREAAEEKASRCEEELITREAEVAELTSEVQRLRVLVQREPEPSPAIPPTQPPPSV